MSANLSIVERDLPQQGGHIFPYKIGYDAAGTVVEIGTDVSRFKVGDSVYVRLPESHRGTTEYRP